MHGLNLCAKGISVTKHVRVDQSYLYADVLNVGQMMDRESALSLVEKILMLALGSNP